MSVLIEQLKELIPYALKALSLSVSPSLCLSVSLSLSVSPPPPPPSLYLSNSRAFWSGCSKKRNWFTASESNILLCGCIVYNLDQVTPQRNQQVILSGRERAGYTDLKQRIQEYDQSVHTMDKHGKFECKWNSFVRTLSPSSYFSFPCRSI